MPDGNVPEPALCRWAEVSKARKVLKEEELDFFTFFFVVVVVVVCLFLFLSFFLSVFLSYFLSI